MANFKTGDEISRILRRERRIREGVQPVLESGVDIKTVNGNSLLGSGDVAITGTVGYPEGTTFPGSPTTGQKFYRTDLNWLCFYDGTRWLTCQEFSLPYTHSGTLPLDISDEWVLRAVPPNDFAAYYTKLYLMVESSGTAHNGSNFIVLSLSTTSTTLATISTSSGIPSNSQVRFDTALNIACPLTDKRVIMTCAVNGTISNTFIYPAIFFRLIVT